MAETMEVKKQVTEPDAFTRYFGADMPLFRGSMFGMNPFALMRQFTEEMDRAFGQAPALLPNGAVWSPAIEVKEAPGKFMVTAELPGLKKEDIKVEVANGMITLEGERKQEKEEKKEGYYRSERSYGKFFRSIPLPEAANTGQITAQFNNGVLEVTVPVAEAKEKRQTIPVQEPAKPKVAA